MNSSLKIIAIIERFIGNLMLLSLLMVVVGSDKEGVKNLLIYPALSVIEKYPMVIFYLLIGNVILQLVYYILKSIFLIKTQLKDKENKIN